MISLTKLNYLNQAIRRRKKFRKKRKKQPNKLAKKKRKKKYQRKFKIRNWKKILKNRLNLKEGRKRKL